MQNQGDSSPIYCCPSGKVIEAGPAADIFADPASAYTRQLMRAALTDVLVPPPDNDVLGFDQSTAQRGPQ